MIYAVLKDYPQRNIKFLRLCLSMNTDNVVSFGPRTKEKFLLEHSIKPQTFNNNVAQLIELCLISRIARNEFLVNKRYAVKVDWEKCKRLFKATTVKMALIQK
ncbi:hypothetical protein ACLB1M_32885 [Escherichia coli]